MSPLKRNGILICSVLFYRANFICIKVVATYIIQFNCVSTLKQVYSSDLSLFGAEAFRERYKKIKNGKLWKWKRRILGPCVAGWWRNTKNMAGRRRTGRAEEAKAGGRTSKAARKKTVRRDGGENLSS